ncbi:unnamed protein product [Effrenium voratum]|uniref:Ribosomal RNA large subunit methyltransferase K/L-like methyltransferase domain-containing protein n=1 Tax=Effrenium voratum TaxID=2562239 RepID=A0AA36NI57_9DINO|nr:unnamed protein product [Effrenium voratum]
MMRKLGNGLRALLLCGLGPALSGWFSAVPPATNPRSRQNAAARAELGALVAELGGEVTGYESRWHFHAPLHTRSLSRLRDLRRVSSVRAVLLAEEYPHASSEVSSEALAEWICGNAQWQLLDAAWGLAGNDMPRSCHVCLRRRKASWPEDLSLKLRRALALRLEASRNWAPEVLRSAADLELHVVLGAGGKVLLEVPLLVQQRGLAGGLPQPGMKQVEAWAVAKSLDIQAADLVLDPMCGKGTLLAEASIWWPARYVGCDTDAAQLAACRENHRYLSAEVETHVANACSLPLPDHSVEKLMTAPPWDRQFAAAGGLEALYPRLLAEFGRVLTPTGRMALLLNSAAFEVLRPLAVHWRLAWRRWRLTRHTEAVLLAAARGGGGEVAPLAPGFDAPRSAWSRLRAEERPRCLKSSSDAKSEPCGGYAKS